MKSRFNDDLYIGSTVNVEYRLRLHNSGKVKSTKGYIPWELLETRACKDRSAAAMLENFLKSGQQKELLRKKYK